MRASPVRAIGLDAAFGRVAPSMVESDVRAYALAGARTSGNAPDTLS